MHLPISKFRAISSRSCFLSWKTCKCSRHSSHIFHSLRCQKKNCKWSCQISLPVIWNEFIKWKHQQHTSKSLIGQLEVIVYPWIAVNSVIVSPSSASVSGASGTVPLTKLALRTVWSLNSHSSQAIDLIESTKRLISKRWIISKCRHWTIKNRSTYLP